MTSDVPRGDQEGTKICHKIKKKTPQKTKTVTGVVCLNSMSDLKKNKHHSTDRCMEEVFGM